MYFCDYEDANFMIANNILQSTGALFKVTVGRERAQTHTHTHTCTPFQLNSRCLPSTEEGVHALWGHVSDQLSTTTLRGIHLSAMTPTLPAKEARSDPKFCFEKPKSCQQESQRLCTPLVKAFLENMAHFGTVHHQLSQICEEDPSNRGKTGHKRYWLDF